MEKQVAATDNVAPDRSQGQQQELGHADSSGRADSSSKGDGQAHFGQVQASDQFFREAQVSEQGCVRLSFQLMEPGDDD